MMPLRYFTLSEFDCRHCGKNQMDMGFLELLDELRHRAGFPIKISSGYRCPEHNQAVSHTGLNGPHTTGHAADLDVNRRQALSVLRVSLNLPFTGVGVQQRGSGRFIHLDNLTEPEYTPRPTIWSY
ncbi:MAG: DUF882 domain-containing protein [Gammaproteobacteria bacterium PRO9]|nr:DUF882 domain-containing protein [Gammaproteobacteria bacterium PRO9]